MIINETDPDDFVVWFRPCLRDTTSLYINNPIYNKDNSYSVISFSLSLSPLVLPLSTATVYNNNKAYAV